LLRGRHKHHFQGLHRGLTKLGYEVFAEIHDEPDRVYRRRLSLSFCGDVSRAICVVEVPFCCCG
jgi:hypothetical protein